MLKTLTTILKLAISLVLIIPLLILIFPIWLFVKMCLLVNSLIKSPDKKWNKIVKYEPELGWKPKSSLDNVKYLDPTGDKASITTGKDGWPGNHAFEESDVAVLGDSFAFGFGAYKNQAYYEFSRDIRIKPIAAPGYNMVHGLLLLKKYREKLRGKLIIWLICLENDLAENIQPYNSMFYRIPFIKMNNSVGHWEIVTSHISNKKWLFGDQTYNGEKFASICSNTPYSGKVFSGCRYLLEEAKKICESINSDLLVFTIPNKKIFTQQGIEAITHKQENKLKFDKNLPDKKFDRICSDLDIDFYSGSRLLNLSDYKARDPHWNKWGNKKMSEFINSEWHKRSSEH